MAENSIPKITVIAPVYGVEKFIGKSVESMMVQTLSEVEFVFVDDCSPDHSMEIVKQIVSRYPNRSESIKFVRHPYNKGLPAARNTGLDIATGEYIFHWDSDDYAEPEMLELLYKEAESKKCDYVWSDWFLTFETNSRIMKQPLISSSRDALSAMLNGSLRYNVWNKIVSRKLYLDTGIRFPEGKSMGEDMTMIRLLAHAHKVGYVSRPLYHYIRMNSDAMTQVYSERHLSELKENTVSLCDYLLQKIADKSIVQELEWFKLNVKLPFLFSGRSSDVDLWHQWFPESNRYIMSNSSQTMRTRLLQLAAACHLSAINRIYNLLVFKFIYGKIYK